MEAKPIVDKANLDKKCKKLYEIRQKKYALQKQIKELDSEFDLLEQEVNDAIVELGQKHWYVKGIATFTPTFKQRISVVNQKKIKDYLTKNNLTDLITVYPQSITNWARVEIEKMASKNKKLIDVDVLNKELEKKFGLHTFEEKCISIRGDGDDGKEK